MGIVRKLNILILLAAMTVIMPSCLGYKDIRLTSCGLKSVSVVGLREADLNLDAEFFNPASSVSVMYLNGTVFRNGVELAQISADPFVVEGRSEKAAVTVPVNVQLSRSVSLLGSLSLLSGLDVRDLSADVELKIKTRGLTKKLKFKNVSVADLLRSVEREAPSNAMIL